MESRDIDSYQVSFCQKFGHRRLTGPRQLSDRAILDFRDRVNQLDGSPAEDETAEGALDLVDLCAKHDAVYFDLKDDNLTRMRRIFVRAPVRHLRLATLSGLYFTSVEQTTRQMLATPNLARSSTLVADMAALQRFSPGLKMSRELFDVLVTRNENRCFRNPTYGRQTRL